MVYCSALNCQNATSGAYKNSSVTFYGFPLQNQALLEQWLRNMGRDMGTPSKYQRLCSEHFEESSFQRDPLKVRKNRRLLKEAVPNKFILGQDGNWLVGTPQGFSDGMRSRTRKRIHRPKHWRVVGRFLYGATGPTLEDWQNEFYKTILKENRGSLTVPGKGCGGATIRSQQRSAENTQIHGSSSGGSRNVPDKGETSGSHPSPTNQANPVGNGRGGESKELLPRQQSHPEASEAPWFICAECGKSFARHAYLIRHLRIHSGERPHACTECGKSFLDKARLSSHLRTHFRIIHVPKDFLG